MNLKRFHYTMIHDEFGEGGLANNYYLLCGLMFAFAIFMLIGGLGWLLYLSQFL